MSSFDLLLLVLLGLAAFRGYMKGFILEIFSLAALVISLLFGMKIAEGLSKLLQGMTSDSRWIPFISYLLAFAGIYFLVLWAGKLVEASAKMLQMGLVNRVAGAALGLIKTAFFISLVFWLAEQVNMVPESYKAKSFLYQLLKDFAPNILTGLSKYIPFLHDIMEKAEKLFHKNQDAAATFIR